MSEKIISAESIFGTGTKIASKTDEITKELNDRKENQKTTAFGVPTESLEDYYKRTIELEDTLKKEEAELDTFFDDFEEEQKEETFDDEVEEDGFFEDEDVNVVENPIDIVLNKVELQKELQEVSDEAIEELLKTTDGQKIKALCESPNYPSDFPNFQEVLKLKKIHDKLVFVITGNLLEEFQYAVVPKLFICTTFKTKDYLDFTSVYPDTDQLMLYPFVAARCTLFPRLEYETIMETNAGIIKKIAENVLINSDYKTSIEVIVL